MKDMKGTEKFVSIFGDYHLKKDRARLEVRRENLKLMKEVAKPVEGLDFLHEDSKAETQAYQDIYNNQIMEEVV